MSDSSEIDAAISAKLLADPTLMGYAKDGIYFDEAASGSQRFITINLVTHFDVNAQGGRSHEEVTYRVKYVELWQAGIGLVSNAKAAAARIDVLLDNKPLTITGYTTMKVERQERIRYTEDDAVDPSIRWAHRGGLYLVMASL